MLTITRMDFLWNAGLLLCWKKQDGLEKEGGLGEGGWFGRRCMVWEKEGWNRAASKNRALPEYLGDIIGGSVDFD